METSVGLGNSSSFYGNYVKKFNKEICEETDVWADLAELPGSLKTTPNVNNLSHLVVCHI